MRLFAMFMAFFLMPLLVLLFAGHVWAEQNIVRNAENSYLSILENVSARLDQDIESLNDVVSLMASDSLLSRLAYASGDSVDYSHIDLSKLQDYKTQIAIYCLNNRLYGDAAVCIPGKNFVISSRGIWRLDWFMNVEMNIDGVDNEQFLQYLGQPTMLYGQEVTIFDARRTGMICFRPALYNSRNEALLSVVFFIDSNVLNEYLADLSLFPGTYVLLQDAAGQEISASGSEDFSGYTGGHTYRDANGSPYRVMTYTSRQQGWQYTVFLPEESLYSEVRAFQLVLYAVFGIMLALGTLLSFELSRINYRPFEELFRMLNIHRTSFLTSDEEIRRATGRLERILDERNILDQRLKANRTALRSAALIQLLEDSAHASMLSESGVLSTLRLPMPHARFAVAMLIRACNLDEETDFTGDGIACYCVRLRNTVAFVVNYEDDATFDAFLEQLAQEFQMAVCASSTIFHALSDLPCAYAEAEKARGQVPVSPEEIAVYRYARGLDAEKAMRISADGERRLAAALRAGDAGEAWDEISALMNAAEPSKATLSTIRKLVNAVEVLVLKTDEGNGLARAVSALPEPANQPDELLHYLRTMLDLAAEYHAAWNERRQSERLEQIISFIEAHLRDPQLNLSMVAEAFGMTSTYFSRYFKDHLHMGYLEFVNRRRIELAREILNSGNCTVHEAAIAVGFASDATFRRLYKKYYGTTPVEALAGVQKPKY